MIDDEKKEKKKSPQSAIRRRRRYLAEHMDEQCIRYIEERFNCNLPCFQKRPDGSFDPLDAMRLDAYREVCLFLRRELSLYQQEKDHD